MTAKVAAIVGAIVGAIVAAMVMAWTIAARADPAPRVVPGGAVPGGAVPGVAVPGGAVPGGAVPGVAVPSVAVPGVAVPAVAAAPPQARWRTGEHPGFSRLVLDLPKGAAATSSVADGRVEVSVPGGPPPPVPAKLPRTVAAASLEGGRLVLRLAPGATARAVRLSDRLVVDIQDAAPPAKGAAAAAPPKPLAGAAPARMFSGPPPRPVPPRPVSSAPPPQAPATQAPATQAAPRDAQPRATPRALEPAAPLPSLPPAAPGSGLVAAAPVPVRSAPLPPPSPGPSPAAVATPPISVSPASGATLVLPFATTAGAAALRRGDMALIVFDERRPLDIAALDVAALAPASAPPGSSPGGASVELLPDATVLRLPLPRGRAVRLAPLARGWSLAFTAEDAAPLPAPITAGVAEGEMRLAAPGPGAVVSVADPVGGGALLVGTLRGPGAAVPLSRRLPEFTLLETVRGVAVEPASDAVQVRPVAQGFAVRASGGRAIALAPDAPGSGAILAAGRLTRRWDLPDLPRDALLRRLGSATAAAAAAPPRGRVAPRLAVVQAQLALGLAAEAQALTTLLVAEDGRAAADPDVAGLGAVAALLAGRPDQSAALDDPAQGGTDELALWRAARQAMRQEGAPAAAQNFAATLPLLLSYPETLRARLLPLVAETMAQGGEAAAARRLVETRPEDGSLALARALVDQAEGRAAPALAALDRLAASPDRAVRARAAVRAVEYRLALGGLTEAEAADALDRLIYAWRGDGAELALRLRVAELRSRAGQWRPALALLRETAAPPLAQTWPEQVPLVRARLADAFDAALDADAAGRLPALDLLALATDNADLLPEGARGQALAARVADRLDGLDLPERAMAALDKLVAAAPRGAARAAFGARLAELRLGSGDPGRALQALAASTAEPLPRDLEDRRTIVFARATAARGGIAAADATLAALDTAAGDDARAALQEAAHHWPEAAAALTTLAGRIVPAADPLPEPATRVLIRLASALAQGGDEAGLAALRARFAARVPAGELGDMFRMLTEPPVREPAELPRAATEAALARTLPLAAKRFSAATP